MLYSSEAENMNISGPRPETTPIHRGEFESLVVYMEGDTVESEGKTWRCLHDLRSGFLPPSAAAEDHPGVYWEEVLP